jgi:hypothetical protein
MGPAVFPYTSGGFFLRGQVTLTPFCSDRRQKKSAMRVPRDGDHGNCVLTGAWTPGALGAFQRVRTYGHMLLARAIFHSCRIDMVA